MSYNLVKVFGPLPPTERGMPVNLQKHPKATYILYTIAKSVIIRNVENPSDVSIHTVHINNVSVASFSPNGNYIASGDYKGILKICDAINPSRDVKYEYQPISGRIFDICWSADNQRIVVCGASPNTPVAAILINTGSSVGQFSGHIKTVISCDIFKPKEMFIASGGEDLQLNFYKGLPFKFHDNNKDHKRFINCVRAAPDASFVASSGQDGQIILHSTTDFKVAKTLGGGKPAHDGGVYSISWSNCGKKLFSVSGDKTAKIWNIESGSCETEFIIGNELHHQQLGGILVGDELLSVSLNGQITYLDINNPKVPKKAIWGHNKPIVAMCYNEGRNKIISAGNDGNICCWDIENGLAVPIIGEGYKCFITSIYQSNGVVSCVGIDDTARFIDLSTLSYKNTVIKLPSQPRSVVRSGTNMTIVGCLEHIVVIKDDSSIVQTISNTFESRALAVHENILLVGCNEKKVRSYTINGDSIFLSNTAVPSVYDTVNYIRISNDGQFAVVADVGHYVTTFEFPSMTPCQECGVHTGKVNWVDVSPDSRRVVSVGVDGRIVFFTLKKEKRLNTDLTIESSHRPYSINCVAFLENNSIITCGSDDCCMKLMNFIIN